MAELTPAHCPDVWGIIVEECRARGWVEWTDAALRMRAETGTMTEADCQKIAEAFGTSVELWRGLHESTAKWLERHKEATGG